ncbi:radical SAM/SPASM domain-containing protein [Brucepastera parasyntrophica]|uniref:radical SAM protein n=1 Tax=Brucepastera parasyntrophica TaxID=2880008 RepID=UPI003F70D8F9
MHCSGCYARANGACGSSVTQPDLDTAKWESIFNEAAQLGIPFILLAGGEPFLRYDVIEAASRVRDIIFPVFTNGTRIDDDCLSLLDRSRNVIPIFSLEGDAAKTDVRRGEGVYAAVQKAMSRLQEKGILFGVSITVTTENMQAVTDPSYISNLRNMGCGLAFFVEYVPVSEQTEHLALDKEDLAELGNAVSALRGDMSDMVILSFPGDEEAMGGCLASGRGFFHINSVGGAEPCPFSPYAKYNLKSCSVLDVLQSGYFAELREIAKNADTHNGGCTLFQERNKVATLYAG